MAKQANHVPKFGDWHGNNEVPYTMVFDNARAGKGTGNKPFNPNDPSQNPSASGLGPGPHNEHQAGGPDAAPPSNNVRRPTARETGDNRGANPANRGRVGVRPTASPARDPRDRKLSSENVNTFASPNHAKGRPRPGSRDEKGDPRVPTLPKFGDWDEKNPAAGEGYTMIFSNARDERRGGPPAIPSHGGNLTPSRNDIAYKSPLNTANSHQKPTQCGCSIL